MVTGTMQLSIEQLRTSLETMAQYGLPQGESALWFDVGTRPYLDYFEHEVIDSYISQGGATCRFFEGAYGAGKTHLLQLLKQLALRKGMIVASTDLSQALKLEDWRAITEYMFQNMEAVVGGQSVRGLAAIVDAMHTQGGLHVEGLSRAQLVHPGYHNALYWATRRRHLDTGAWRTLTDFLGGRKVTAAELRRYLLEGVKGQLTQRNAELVLKTVLGGLYRMGVPGVLLLFDENESTLASNAANPPKKHRLAANLMRRLIDGCSTDLLVGTAVVFAVLPGFLEHCSQAYPALGQRLQIVRGGLQQRAWRVPVQLVDRINSIDSQELFLEEAANMLVHYAGLMCAAPEGLKAELMAAGERVLEHNVGMGYKRELMKTLANLTVRYVDREEQGA